MVTGLQCNADAEHFAMQFSGRKFRWKTPCYAVVKTTLPRFGLLDSVRVCKKVLAYAGEKNDLRRAVNFCTDSLL